MGRRWTYAFAALAISVLSGVSLAVAASDPSPERGAAPAGANASLANRCIAIAAAQTGEFVTIHGEQGYGADAEREREGAGFHLKPTGVGSFLIQGENGALVAAGENGQVVHSHAPSPLAEWTIGGNARASYTFTSVATGEAVALDPATGELLLGAAGAAAPFDLTVRERCLRYPEAQVAARGKPARRTRRDGSVFGIADAHMHITANLRAGGRVIHGEPFSRYGLPEALGNDEVDHGPDGSLDTVGNLLRTGEPVGTHNTEGWPSFAGWPVHDTYTHQQGYYVWIKRMWKAGLRVLVAQAVEDEALCNLAPMKSHSCDETETVKLAVERLKGLEAYVDAQAGGRGKGWFRLVYNPRQARRVAEQGKLAVIIGMETSSPLGCEEFQGEPQCTPEQIDQVLGELHALGVRSVFIAHWVDNAFAGAALQSGAQGDFIDVFQETTTGHPFATQPCGDADEANGTCNAKGFTETGRYLLERMMEKHMLIEADHLSQAARPAVFDLVDEHDYPLVSSHTGTGGEWTQSQLDRLHELGGISAATPEVAPDYAQKVNRLRAETGDRRAAVALGSDTGGISALPGPREDAAAEPLEYPFRSHDGGVRFKRQRTGQRTYDLNTDGVAHYGLFADLLADMGRQPGGRAATRALFRSAEGYIEMWERTYAD